MLNIQKMPDIWDNTSFMTSRSAVLGALASWSVRQSPYLYPDNLEKGLLEFDSVFVADDHFEINCNALRNQIYTVIDKCPTILGWSVPKKGRHITVFCSRYDQPHPDYDFIDLSALARNVAHTITLEEKYSKLNE